MSLLNINWTPTRNELRVFAALLLIFGLLLGWMLDLRSTAGVSVAIACSAACVVGLLWPAVLRPLYVVWMAAVFPVGWVVSHALMAIVYYGLITAIGLALRCVGYDPMQRSWDRQARSYWKPRKNPADARRYFRPY